MRHEEGSVVFSFCIHSLVFKYLFFLSLDFLGAIVKKEIDPELVCFEIFCSFKMFPLCS